MAYDLTGKVKVIQDTMTFDSGFKKREVVVTVDDGRYPQDISLEFVQDKISLLDDLQPGQEVTVTFDIRGREYKGRYFNNLQGWKIEVLDNNQSATTGAQAATAPAPADFDDEDIPF